MFGALAVRVTQLQVLSGDRYKSLALAQRLRTIPLPADRGSIFDRNGRDLAMSVQRSTVWADPTLVTEPVATATKLAPLLGVAPATLVPLLSDRTHRFKYLAHTVDDAVADHVKALNLPGVGLVDESKRTYPGDSVAAPVLGRVGGVGQGLDGLEAYYEDTLTGRPGKLVVEQDQDGRDIPNTQRQRIDARRGTDIVLTIDESLQYVVEHSLVDEVTATAAKGGMAVLLDVTTGEVLAMATVLGATPTEAARPAGADEKNRPLTDVFEPGSTMKLITLSTAIDDGVVTPASRFEVPQTIAITANGRTISPPYTDVHAHGVENWSVTDIMRESSNVGVVKIAQKMDSAELANGLRAFGLGRRTAIDFPGQSEGLLTPPDKYYATGKTSTAIGYGNAVTAMQMLDAYTTIANDGVTRPPRLIRSMIDASGVRRSGDGALPKTKRIVSAGTAQAMRQMLTQVVGNGTGGCAAVPGYTTAGKTGTAHKAAQGGYTGGTMASFIGFAPAESPRFASIVVLDEPANQYGGAASAPVFSEIMQFALMQYRVPPTDAANTQFTAGRARAGRDGTPCTVPHGADLTRVVQERQQREADRAAAAAAAQSPSAGSTTASSPAAGAGTQPPQPAGSGTGTATSTDSLPADMTPSE